MNLSQFFRHWSIAENPFRGEEARNDEVFHRLQFIGEDDAAAAAGHAGDDVTLGSLHSDFEKILGELTRPSTSVVFGEKGSGKTAIKLQILARIDAHNRRRPDAKALVIPYDELNPYITELHDRYASPKDPLAEFKKVRLVDHMDAILSIATDRLVASLFKEAPDRPAFNIPDDYVRLVRKLPEPVKHDALLLQALYDPADTDGSRTAKMRRLLRLPADRGRLLWNAAAAALWLLPAAALFFAAVNQSGPLAIAGLVLLLLYLALPLKLYALDRYRVRRLAARVRADMRMLPRTESALAASLAQLDEGHRTRAQLPVTDSADEPRYHALGVLRRLLARLGYTGLIVVIDRVDEPTLVNGDTEKMRELMWPLFNNKFLQQEGFGVKMLLPIELRHALFRESAKFFQEARLDKQGLVERLTWTGPMLYDLCNARLHACRAPGAEPVNLSDIFEDDVNRADIVDALDQMHQPRDAFKMLYRCMNEHCSNVTADENAWKIPRLVLEQVRRAESDRVQALYRGVGPA